MKDCLDFYINGEWVKPATPNTFEVHNPANDEVIGHISLGSKADVDKAVAAAKKAFETFSRTTREERVALLERVLGAYQNHLGELA
jgi:aldehyde dehydrogenase (NAD+)